MTKKFIIEESFVSYADIEIYADNQELRHINEKISILINQLDDYREERIAEKLGIEKGNIKLEITD